MDKNNKKIVCECRVLCKSTPHNFFSTKYNIPVATIVAIISGSIASVIPSFL